MEVARSKAEKVEKEKKERQMKTSAGSILLAIGLLRVREGKRGREQGRSCKDPLRSKSQIVCLPAIRTVMVGRAILGRTR